MITAGRSRSFGQPVPYELGTVPGFAPTYLRGQAFLSKRSGQEAAREFRTILDHRGIDPFSPLYALAYLGLGRASALAGDLQQAQEAYDQFFTLWTGADADVPITGAHGQGHKVKYISPAGCGRRRRPFGAERWAPGQGLLKFA